MDLKLRKMFSVTESVRNEDDVSDRVEIMH